MTYPITDRNKHSDARRSFARRGKRKPNTPRPAPDAWTLDEMRAIVEACRKFRGQFFLNGIDRGRWWEAFVLVSYDTALGRDDMLAVKRSQMESDKGGAVLRIAQDESCTDLIRRLRPATVEAVNATYPPNRELVFDFPHSRYALHLHWKEILQFAGLDPLNRHNGVHKLRRTSAIHLERTNPGAGMAHLGHRSADMAMKHYPGPKDSDIPLPPPFLVN